VPVGQGGDAALVVKAALECGDIGIRRERGYGHLGEPDFGVGVKRGLSRQVVDSSPRLHRQMMTRASHLRPILILLKWNRLRDMHTKTPRLSERTAMYSDMRKQHRKYTFGIRMAVGSCAHYTELDGRLR